MGFFSPSEWQKQRLPLRLEAECGRCGLHRHVRTPFMPVAGKGRRRALIVAEAPGENEDDRGEPLVGNAGLELVRILHTLKVNMRKDCWLFNSVICRPTDDRGRNRAPTKEEIDYCQPNLAKTLLRLKPDVVIPLGYAAIRSVVALAWGKGGEVDNVQQWAGWQIPCQKYNCWIHPTYHPSFLLREQERRQTLPTMLTAQHLKDAFDHDGKPWKSQQDWSSRVDVVMDPKLAAKYVRTLMAAGKPLAFDYETTTLKPDGPHAEILCCSVSDGEVSVAFPWARETAQAVKELAVSSVPKIAANLDMEARWTRKFLGVWVKNWWWDCVLGAHWRNCIEGTPSLKFQAFVLLGMTDFDHLIEPFKKGKDSNSPNQLKTKVEPWELMQYCGMDSLLEVRVSMVQRHLVKCGTEYGS